MSNITLNTFEDFILICIHEANMAIKMSLADQAAVPMNKNRRQAKTSMGFRRSRTHWPHAIPSRKDPGNHTNSEHDWAWIPHELAYGKDAAKLTRTIASRRWDNPVASARLCLNEGVPMEDVCHVAGGPPPLRDCLCTVYPKRPKQGCGGVAREKLTAGGSPRLLCGC